MSFVEMAYQHSHDEVKGQSDAPDTDACSASPDEFGTVLPNIEAELEAITKNSGRFSRLLERIVTEDAPEDTRIIQFMGVDGQKSASTIARQFALYASRHFPAPVCLMGPGAEEDGRALVYSQTETNSNNSVVLSEQCAKEGLRKVRDAELYVSTAGYGQSSETLGTLPMRFDGIRKQLASRFPLIIVHTELNSSSIEGVLISSKVDGVILVLEAERSRRDLANDACRRIERAGGRVVGAVLMEKRRYVPSFLRRWFE